MADDPKHLNPAQLLRRAHLGRGALRSAFGTAGRVAPGMTARLAEALFFRTPRGATRSEEVAFLDRANRFVVNAAGARVEGYLWGESGPLIVFAHGWLSNAGRVAPLAQAILATGGRVAAFDAPGHGRSSGWRSSMPEFAAALKAVVDSVGPAHALVGHSLGGAASVYAISRGLPINRAVTIAAPADLSSWADHFRDLVGLSPDVYERMQRRAERRLAITWADLDIPTAARSLTIPGLVIHDVHDPDVPWSEGVQLGQAWEGAEVMTTEGLGHRAILRDPEVIRRVVEFVARS
ncbi:MAG: alpha/beta fold hydrolase [Gemmatimonadales bacterium]